MSVKTVTEAKIREDWGDDPLIWKIVDFVVKSSGNEWGIAQIATSVAASNTTEAYMRLSYLAGDRISLVDLLFKIR